MLSVVDCISDRHSFILVWAQVFAAVVGETETWFSKIVIDCNVPEFSLFLCVLGGLVFLFVSLNPTQTE